MKRFIQTITISILLSFSSLYAHGSHSHSHAAPTQAEVSKTDIKKMAKQELKRLALAGKIDKSWLFVPVSKMKKTAFNYNNEWVVSFKNEEIKEKSKETLYIFFTVYGDLTGANYTGK